MKTSELTGAALDWAVAKCEGHMDDETIIRRLEPDEEGWCIAYSTDWAQGGPIIECERIAVEFLQWDDMDSALPVWLAETQCGHNDQSETGPTPLVAAMRCYVVSKLGDEVEIPEELT